MVERGGGFGNTEGLYPRSAATEAPQGRSIELRSGELSEPTVAQQAYISLMNTIQDSWEAQSSSEKRAANRKIHKTAIHIAGMTYDQKSEIQAYRTSHVEQARTRHDEELAIVVSEADKFMRRGERLRRVLNVLQSRRRK